MGTIMIYDCALFFFFGDVTPNIIRKGETR